MRMQKRKFRIGELAQHLNVERFVVRFWEKEFGLKTDRSGGGQRFYEESDIERFMLIKDLLYNKGFTIAGAKQELKRLDTPNKSERVVASKRTSLSDAAHQDSTEIPSNVAERILELQNQLRKLRELL